MTEYRNIYIILLSLFTLIAISFAFEECTPHPPCYCEYDDGRVIDLNPLSKESFINASSGNLTYYFHACTNIKLVIPNVSNATQNCNKGTSLCLYNHADNTISNLGKSEDSKLVSSITDPGKYDLMYTDIKNKTTFITLGCSDISETFLIAEHNFPHKHDLILFSHYACAHLIVHGMSTGSVLVILLLIFTSVYLLGGAAILHFLRGARGKEMIPNIDFWSDLPLLVRDGVIFLQNGCKPSQPREETYDRI